MSTNTREERAAILLNGLDPETAESVLRRLAPEQGNRLRTQMNRLYGTSGQRELLGEVVQEFGAWMRTTGRDSPEIASGNGLPGPGPTYGDPRDKGRRPSSPLPERRNEVADGGDVLAALRQLPVDRLAAALHGEHTHTVSLVLDALSTEQAGEVLKRLPTEVRREVSVRLGQGVDGNSALMQQIARALLQKTRAGNEVRGSAARAEKIAEMLRALDRVERLDLLAVLEQRDPETAARVKANLYRFEDLTRIADRCVQKVLVETDLRTLVIALKDASEPVTQKVMSNVSPRIQESLADEAELVGAIAPVQVQLARRTILETIQRLDQAGDLEMAE